MTTYQMRRIKQQITDEQEILDILRNQLHTTLAMSRDGEPYLVTVVYIYDQSRHCLYFHCAREGKKVDFLRSNPRVWGQILEDRGYVQGGDYSYRSLQFSGEVEFVEDENEVRAALRRMFERFDSDPEPLIRKYMTGKYLPKILVGKVTLQEVTGKQSPAP